MLDPNLMQYCKKSGCQLHCVRRVKPRKTIFCYLNKQTFFCLPNVLNSLKGKRQADFEDLKLLSIKKQDEKMKTDEEVLILIGPFFPF